jgi:hypothetical protein
MERHFTYREELPFTIGAVSTTRKRAPEKSISDARLVLLLSMFRTDGPFRFIAEFIRQS